MNDVKSLQQTMAEEWAVVRQMEIYKLLLAGPEDAEIRAIEELVSLPDKINPLLDEYARHEKLCRDRIHRAREFKLFIHNAEAIYKEFAEPLEPETYND